MTKNIEIFLNNYAKTGNLDKFKKKIQNRIASVQDWIFTDPLSDVIIELHLAYLSNPKLINGYVLGLLTRRLIDSEIEVGGPYISYADLYTNALVAQFLRALGSPLPKLESFLKNNPYLTEKNNEKKVLNIFSNIDRSEDILVAKQNINKPSVIAKNKIKKLNPEIQKIGLTFWKRILAVDKRSEISLISSYFLNSLIEKPTKSELELSDQLGAANFYAWIAYTIYDDFIDEEGKPELLSLANIMHRLSYEVYLSHFKSDKELINNHYDSVDNSNFWELQNCRFKIHDNYIDIGDIPNYANGNFLAERALGHILGPRLILKIKLKLRANQELMINRALSDYLIARQISDDLKDWREDLRKGHISYVLSKLLIDTDIKKGSYDIEELILRLQSSFWQNIFEECSSIIINKLKRAENDLTKTYLFVENNVFAIKILRPLKTIAESDLSEYLDGKIFLKTYKPPPSL